MNVIKASRRTGSRSTPSLLALIRALTVPRRGSKVRGPANARSRFRYSIVPIDSRVSCGIDLNSRTRRIDSSWWSITAFASIRLISNSAFSARSISCSSARSFCSSHQASIENASRMLTTIAVPSANTRGNGISRLLAIMMKFATVTAVGRFQPFYLRSPKRLESARRKLSEPKGRSYFSDSILSSSIPSSRRRLNSSGESHITKWPEFEMILARNDGTYFLNTSTLVGRNAAFIAMTGTSSCMSNSILFARRPD